MPPLVPNRWTTIALRTGPECGSQWLPCHGFSYADLDHLRETALVMQRLGSEGVWECVAQPEPKRWDRVQASLARVPLVEAFR